MSKYNREFLTDIGNAERAEDATEDFEYDNYDDLSDDDLLAKIKADHEYDDDELDDIYSKWNSDDWPVTIESKAPFKPETPEERAMLETVSGHSEDQKDQENQEDDIHTIDSTGTVSDTDDDEDWGDIKDTLSNLKGY